VTGKGSSLLDRARRSPANWSREDLERLYKTFGFEIVRGTKHAFARHPKFPELRGTVPNHRSFATGYVRSAVKLIEKLEALEKQEQEDREEE
jgi:hypothetical protein